MSPFAEEMQKDEPSTKVTVPGPTGPAAVSAFHPAIPVSFNEMTHVSPVLTLSPRVGRHIGLSNRRYACLLPDASDSQDRDRKVEDLLAGAVSPGKAQLLGHHVALKAQPSNQPEA